MSSSKASEHPRRALEDLFLRTVAALDPRPRVVDWLREHKVSGPHVVLALGKSAGPMVAGAHAVLGDEILEEWVALPDDGTARALDPGWMPAAHPSPDVASERAGRALLAAASRAEVPLLVLVSGGGSSLAAVPADGISLADKARALRLVYDSGADIGELNIVRKHLSAIKGGQLVASARVSSTSLVVSDTVGDDLSLVASGPSVADPSTFAQAVAIVSRRVGLEALPEAVAQRLRAGAAGSVPETPKAFGQEHRAFLLSGMGLLVDTAAHHARALGPVFAHGANWSGDVAEIASRLAALSRAQPGCHVAAGEATIELGPEPGRGGRAHQIALLVARELAGQKNLSVLVAGTDGQDGNSGAAGAVVDGETWGRLRAAEVDADGALARCDAAAALEVVGASLVTGPTGVNHADLFVVLAGAPSA